MLSFYPVSSRQTMTAKRRPEFQTYLDRSNLSPFTLNLEGKSLMEVIEAAITAKSKRSPHYRRQLSSLTNNLTLLEKTYHTRLKTVQVTDIFWDYFVAFCSERGLRMSTIATITNQLRSVLNWAVKYNATVSPTYSDIRVPQVHNEKIALTADEVARIRYFDVDRFYANRRKDFRETMKRTRDMFVLGCNLYQRHSDLVRISRECFSRNIFKITQQKTGNKAVVDIDKYSIDPKTTYEILERYNYEAPYKVDVSLFDRRLHTLMHDIGFNDMVRIERRVNGELVAENVPKWKLISSHTIRRTAITVNVLRGHNMHALKRCSGHTDLRIFDEYIRDE